jgi:AAA15 family ATPase/GTPase
MLHSFSCKNLYSFGDLTTVDFVVNDNTPENHGYFKDGSGTRLSKIETIIGPNASGKTNLIKTLPLLKWLIIDSFNNKPEALIPVKPFALGKKKDELTELSVVFEINDKIYTYSFSLNNKKIISEELKLKSKAKNKITSKRIFSRSWDDKNERYIFASKAFKLPSGFEKILRNNASVVSTANRLNHKESQEISHFWQNIETNIANVGIPTDSVGAEAMASMVNQYIIFDFYSKNAAIKEEAEKILSRFDLGLNDFKITMEDKGDGNPLQVTAGHLFEGKKEYFPLGYESSGTKKLFELLKPILQALATGGVAVLDEIDVNLHPEMVVALFNLFSQPETNPKNAQMLFSTHSHLILSKLDKYQIILVEKNQNGVSESWRLDEVSGIRADDNYYSKYIAGAYGAVPKI